MTADSAITNLLDGFSVVFLGAGFSRGATNIAGLPLPIGTELAKKFSGIAGLPPGSSLEDSSEAYMEKFGPDELMREIQRGFTVKDVKSFHQHIAQLPWKRIYTTNYDNVMELAARTKGKQITAVTLSDDVYKLPKKDAICIHMNGFVERLDRTKIQTELKLTETSYLTTSVATSPWAFLFRQDLKTARSVFFLGYSLFDIDIKRLLVESNELKEKTFFVLGEHTDEATVRRAKKFGTILNTTVEGFAGNVSTMAASHVRSSATEFITLSTKEFSSPSPAKITDRAFLDLLMLGNSTPNLVTESLNTRIPYFLERHQHKELFDLIQKGHRVLAITSDLGNGKTLFLEGVRLSALEKGYRVFDVRDHSDSTTSELQAIAGLEERTITIIEDYQSWQEEIRYFRQNANPNAVLLLTARNAVHDVVFDDLVENSGTKNIPEVGLDILSDQEIDWLVKTLDQYGLWGEMAGHPRRAKARFIEDKCQRQFHAVLLKVLESPTIARRIQKIVDALKSGKTDYRVLIGIMIMTLLNTNFDIETLGDIWGVETISDPRFRNDRAIKEFVDFSTNSITVRSSVAAQYLLRKITDASTIVDVLVMMAERSAEGARVSYSYEALFKSLMRFSSLQLLLPDENKRNATIKYYESIKNLGRCKYNPLFWLQYAIASLVFGDLPRSKTYFDTAYSLATAKGGVFNTYQIDNHYARFLLVQAVSDLGVKEALGNFRLARDIVNRQIRDERLHYPYRVAATYQQFLDRFSKELSTTEIEEVARAATTIVGRISQLPDYRLRHRSVVECQKAMEYVISQARDILASRTSA